jgi:hypothetical protein
MTDISSSKAATVGSKGREDEEERGRGEVMRNVVAPPVTGGEARINMAWCRERSVRVRMRASPSSDEEGRRSSEERHEGHAQAEEEER